MRETLLIGLTALFASFPATSNYQLNSYNFGSGGTAKSSTTTYSLEGSSGELSGETTLTANGQVKPGFTETQQANVPKLASLDNNGGQYYNKLHFVIDQQSNPNDATYLVAVSTDNFVSNIAYVQPDGTLGASLQLSDYQTYAAWGGSSGSVIIGLLPSTTYDVKLKATQGTFTESAYGPVSSQATAAPSLTFSLVTSTQPSPPFSVSLGTLTAGSVATSSQTINTTISTNGTSGGDVYIRSQNSGLLSSSTGYKINTTSTDLTSASEGFGAQITSVAQTSGGPLGGQSPYAGSSNVVGLVDGTLRSLYSSLTPVTNGAGSLQLKAKSATNTIAATDYQEVLTLVAAANF